MKNAWMCLGPKMSLTSLRCELTAQGAAYQCSNVECEDHSAIHVPHFIYNNDKKSDKYLTFIGRIDRL